MTNKQRRYTSRSNRPNKPNRTNKILNALIGLVIVLIVITGGIIFLGNDEADQANSKDSESQVSKAQDESTPGATGVPEADESSEDVGSKEIESDDEDAEKAKEEEAKAKEEAAKAKEEAAKETEKEKETTKEDSATGGTVTSTPTDDPIVAERVVNTAWKPVGTSQTGEHASVYSEGHVDWNEKINAISYTTGLSTDNMIVWIIQNGGGPQKSVGVVSSKNKEEKYRVYLQWVDGQGWKPEKMETLKTLDGAY
ncbi:MAG TPA: YrrS family protein [Paenisporosarcina sp.]|nr:YrrS family protein [Paenisporosarcina sp.]